MKYLSSIAAVVALSFAPQAFAQDQQVDDAGFSIAVEAGIGNQQVDVSGGYEKESGSSFSPSLALAYNFNQNVAIVAQYTDYGAAELFDESYSGVNVKASTDMSGVSLVARYLSTPNMSGWSFGGKLGLMSWSSDLYADLSAQGESLRLEYGEDDGVAIYGGLMAAYEINENVSLLLNTDFFLAEPDSTLIAGEKTEILAAHYSLGIEYRF